MNSSALLRRRRALRGRGMLSSYFDFKPWSDAF
jgi:hypothetical protein